MKMNRLTSAKFGVFTTGFLCLALGSNLSPSPSSTPGGFVGFLLVEDVKCRKSFAGNVTALITIHKYTHMNTVPHLSGSHLPVNRWETVLLMHEGCFVFLTGFFLKKLLGF